MEPGAQEVGDAATALAAPRRVRFSASDDLRLLQCVRLHQPYGAEHGQKIRMWERVAQELRLGTDRMVGVPLTGRAVSDRFQLLLKLHRNGALRVKSPPAVATELQQVMNDMLAAIAVRIDAVRASRGKPAKRYGQVSATEALRLHSEVLSAEPSPPPVDEVMEVDDKRAGDEDDLDDATAASTLYAAAFATERAALRESSECAVDDNDDSLTGARGYANDQESSDLKQTQLTRVQTADVQRGKQQLQQHQLTAQLVALEAEKLRLKKRKLAMLAQQHEEHMALLRERMVLDERRFLEEAAARRHEWQQLLARLAARPMDAAAMEPPIPPPPPPLPAATLAIRPIRGSCRQDRVSTSSSSSSSSSDEA